MDRARIGQYVVPISYVGIILLCLFALPPRVLSATAEDYASVLGSEWTFTFNLGGTDFNDTITFSESTYENTSGNIVLDCTSSIFNPSNGTASFDDADSTFGLLFYAGQDTFAWAYYKFMTESGDTASGYLAFYDAAGSYINSYATTGVRTASATPAVDFSASALKGPVPFSVDFTDQSTGSPATWSWDFGDGGTADVQNPSHIYTAPGIYTVSLTTTDGSSSTDNATMRNYIVATDADGAVPIHSFLIEQTWPILQQNLYFSGAWGLTTDRRGNIYLANSWKDKIVKLSPDGQLITSFGGAGREDGKFLDPSGVAVDDDGNIYVADNCFDSSIGDDGAYDLDYCRVHKFNPEGQVITAWNRASGPGDLLNKPGAISIDAAGNVLVTDVGNNRIVKFSPDGAYLGSLDSAGQMAFNEPSDAEVGPDGNLYVMDGNNGKVHQFSGFTSDSFIQSFDAAATGTPFYSRSSLSFDNDGNIYVGDSYNDRIVKITPAGLATVTVADATDSGLSEIAGIVIDDNDNMYVSNYWAGHIQKFSLDGKLIASWGSSSGKEGMFRLPHAMTVADDGSIYVADSGNYRIQKFDVNGNFVREWGSKGSGDGQFGDYSNHVGPHGIMVDDNGNIIVADTMGIAHNRLQFFDPDGNFLGKFGSYGSGDNQFGGPHGLAQGPDGHLYVVENSGQRVHKLGIDYNAAEKTYSLSNIDSWGQFGITGSGNGQFDWPRGITIDQDGYVYVADTLNNRIQKFDADGAFIMAWGANGQAPGQLYQPWDVQADTDGNIIVADTYNARLQRFTPHGTYIDTIGESGVLSGQFSQPQSIALGPDGALYVCEATNNRIQKFKRVTTLSNSKAIILAGRKPPRDPLWPTTQVYANFAYITLTRQGYTKERIYYLSSDTDLDLDENDEADDVDADATNANLEYAITQWAAEADNLVIYMIDHGGNQTFQMSPTETLTAADLDNWLDALQATITGKIILVYDACESGSFVSALAPPPGYEDKRVVITSASPNEPAQFNNNGAISFSSYFWSQIFNGFTVGEAYDLADTAMAADQTPLLDDSGDGSADQADDGLIAQATYIGAGSQIQGDAPVIGSLSVPSSVSDSTPTVLAAVNVTDDNGIARVWAVIRPPNFNVGSADNPVQDMPTIDLHPTDADPSRFEVIYEDFHADGTYQIAFYARDNIGNTSIPKLASVSVNNSRTRKAIIAAAPSTADDLWPAVAHNVKAAYEALSFQGYTDDNIYLISPASIAGVAKQPVLNTLANLNFALGTWVSENTVDVVVYMVGAGGNETFRISDTETLAAVDLDSLLDALQDPIDPVVDRITVVYDACRSGSFLPVLTPPAGQERFLLTSSAGDQAANFQWGGNISFSHYFWLEVLNGTTVQDAFLQASDAVKDASGLQTSQLDDSGNGIGNEEGIDGRLARHHTLGFGILLAGAEPSIGAISPTQELTDGSTSATIWIDDVTTTSTIDTIWATISGPSPFPRIPEAPVIDPPSMTLAKNAGTGRYEGDYAGFSNYGDYTITVYAMDVSGNISLPKTTTVHQKNAPDAFEDDDTYETASVISAHGDAGQRHHNHDAGDQDWIKLYLVAGNDYEVRVENPGASMNPVIELFAADGQTMLARKNAKFEGESEQLFLPSGCSTDCSAEGIYYIRITNFDAAASGENTQYDLLVWPQEAGSPGDIVGRVVNAAGDGIGSALVQSSGFKTLTYANGYFILTVSSGTHTLLVSAGGFLDASVSGVIVQADDHESIPSITLAVDDPEPPVDPGNVNNDQSVTLADAILALKITCGADTGDENVKAGADVNGDGKIGIEEVIYILQKVSVLR